MAYNNQSSVYQPIDEMPTSTDSIFPHPQFQSSPPPTFGSIVSPAAGQLPVKGSSAAAQRRRRSLSTPAELLQSSTAASRPPLLLRRWLIEQAERRVIPGLQWMADPDGFNRNLLRIPWRHGSRSEFNGEADGLLFRAWAHYKGRIVSQPRYKDWKRNFRCALNSLKDVRIIKALSKRSGPDAFVVYEFTPELPKKRDNTDFPIQVKMEENSLSNTSDESEDSSSDPSNCDDVMDNGTNFQTYNQTSPVSVANATSSVSVATFPDMSGTSAPSSSMDTFSDIASGSSSHGPLCLDIPQMWNVPSTKMTTILPPLTPRQHSPTFAGQQPPGPGTQRVLSPARPSRPSVVSSPTSTSMQSTTSCPVLTIADGNGFGNDSSMSGFRPSVIAYGPMTSAPQHQQARLVSSASSFAGDAEMLGFFSSGSNSAPVAWQQSDNQASGDWNSSTYFADDVEYLMPHGMPTYAVPYTSDLLC